MTLEIDKSVVLKRCNLVQAIEYLGLNWKPYDMYNIRLDGGNRISFGIDVYLKRYPNYCTEEEFKYFEGIEKGATRLYKAFELHKISHFYGMFVDVYKVPRTNGFERIEVPDDYIIKEVDFCEQVLCFNKGCYYNVEFDTADIANLLKIKVNDESPQDRIRLTKKLARELFEEGITKEQELYDAINKKLVENGYKAYSRRSLDRLLEPLDLSLEKNPRGKPKKQYKTIA